MIKLDKISYKYGTYSVFKNQCASYELEKKYLIEGPNGSGKTTFLKLVAGLVQPSSGAVTIPHKRIGFVGHLSMCYRSLTVAENINFFKDCCMSKASLDLEEWSLSKKIDSQVSTLSEGEKLKLSILLALLNSPEILLLDEPTSSLDATGVELLNQKLNSLSPTTTIFIVSHDPKNITLTFDKRIKCPELSVH